MEIKRWWRSVGEGEEERLVAVEPQRRAAERDAVAALVLQGVPERLRAGSEQRGAAGRRVFERGHLR